MEQEKAVWTYYAFDDDTAAIRENGLDFCRVAYEWLMGDIVTEVHTFDEQTDLIENKLKKICARLNATEGLNVEALPELIEAAKEAVEALKTASVRMKMETFATSKLQSALTKLGE